MSESGENYRMAVIAERNGTTYQYKVKFDGDSEASQKYYKSLGGLYLSTGARVLCLKVSGTWIIMGKVS